MSIDSDEQAALGSTASALSIACLSAANDTRDEANLRYAIEKAIEQACSTLRIPLQQHRFEIQLKTELNITNFADSIHGALIIEYEPPRSFSKGRSLSVITHAKQQAENYAQLMTAKEGRTITDYHTIIFDGETIAFGRYVDPNNCEWEPCQEFIVEAARRFLVLLKEQGKPLVSPQLLRIELGIGSYVGKSLLPILFDAVLSSIKNKTVSKSKTYLLFTEWSRLFGQAVGVSSDKLNTLLDDISTLHGKPYKENVPVYLFSLHTYLALIAKLVAAMSLPDASFQISDPNIPIKNRISLLESGALYEHYNVLNMMSGDFFSWYVDDVNWTGFEGKLVDIVELMRGMSFDVAKMTPESIRDLFKGLYQEIIPKDLRHSLGEIYTPDWLARFAFDKIRWTHLDGVLDPACGTGTFLIEAVKRRLQEGGSYQTAKQLLDGIYGIDLNPLAVLASKASLVLLISKYLPGVEQVHLPVFLADSINQVDARGLFYEHTIQTEIQNVKFRIPRNLVDSKYLFIFFEKLRTYIDEGFGTDKIYVSLQNEFGGDLFPLSGERKDCLVETIDSLLFLHDKQWNSIWCSILADRFAVCSIKNINYIVGNPPWVKWSHLPTEYASFIKPICRELNIFSDASYVGGIESDISIVFTYKALHRWLAPDGVLAFFITGTVFSDESSQGFRRFADGSGQPICSVISVDDFQSIKPFEGVSNHPALLVLRKGLVTDYPIPYIKWEKIKPSSSSPSISIDVDIHSFKQVSLSALPVPGTDGGPWLKGTCEDLHDWSKIFDASQVPVYVARKGITTDLNGAYFVEIVDHNKGGITIQNNPELGKGKNRSIPKVKRLIESDHVFPLLLGRHVSPYFINIDQNSYVILPQRGMHGDPDLPITHPRTSSYFKVFNDWLQVRGSYKKYQKKHPYWSVWSTGTYTFSKYKVVWREIASGRFCAACVSPLSHAALGEKIVIPDHKVYFIPTDDRDEAYFLTGILNSPLVSKAISSYAAQLSFGTSLCKYVKLPKYDGTNVDHMRIVGIVSNIYNEHRLPSPSIEFELDRCVKKLF